MRSSGLESDWDFGSALGIMGKAKRKTRLADYDFKMAESKLCKTRGKEKKNHLECFLAKGKFTSSSRRTKSPVHTVLVKWTHSFSKEMAFPSIFVGTQMYVHGCKLARELGF